MPGVFKELKDEYKKDEEFGKIYKSSLAMNQSLLVMN
jgi:hypothetical protein